MNALDNGPNVVGVLAQAGVIIRGAGAGVRVGHAGLCTGRERFLEINTRCLASGRTGRFSGLKILFAAGSFGASSKCGQEFLVEANASGVGAVARAKV